MNIKYSAEMKFCSLPSILHYCVSSNPVIIFAVFFTPLVSSVPCSSLYNFAELLSFFELIFVVFATNVL